MTRFSTGLVTTKMGKIPYCGKEERKPQGYTWWTPEMVDQVRQMKASGMTNIRVAHALGVTRGSVLHALARYREHNAESHSA